MKKAFWACLAILAGPPLLFAQSVSLPDSTVGVPGQWIVLAPLKVDGGPVKWRFDPALQEVNLGQLLPDEMVGKLKMAAEEIGKGEFASPLVVMSGMFAAMNRMNDKMCKMAEKMAELEKFKADVEGQQKMAEVEKTLGEMAEKVVIPEEAMSEMRAGADKFSFEQLDAWKNECKAKSFDFAVKDKKGESHLRIGLPVINKMPRPQNDLWAGVK
jgi:hypothetical protein